MASQTTEGMNVLKQTFKEFSQDDCTRMAAALAYYTIFSLPPVLLLVVIVAGALFGEQAVRGELVSQIQGVVGADVADQIQQMIRSAHERLAGSGGVLATLLSIGALLFGATGAFAQLQDALNRAWNVAPDPERGGIRRFLMKRVISFVMVLGVALLLLVSLLLSSALSGYGEEMTRFLPGGLSQGLLQVLSFVVSFGIITLLFAAIFKVLPDAQITWRDVWVGALATALLFMVGKFLISLYLGRSDTASTFGGAGALALLLLWIYFSSLIFFVGAEFTQVWARHYGRRITPDEDAVHVEREVRHIRNGDHDGNGVAEPVNQDGYRRADGRTVPAGEEAAEADERRS